MSELSTDRVLCRTGALCGRLGSPTLARHMNEWDFTDLAARWMQKVIDTDPSLPFREARTEQQSHGSLKRRDLTLYDAGQRPLLTGEVKMPYQPEGNSPYRYDVVRDARDKAKRAGCEYCFTWNVNRLVVWPTTPRVAGGRLGTSDDAFRDWDDIVGVYRPAQMESADVKSKIQRFLVTFLREAARIVRGDAPLGWRRPDDKFVAALEAALEQPVLLTTDALAARYKQPRERTALQGWMRDEQGWSVADPADARGTLDNLADAARFANYALMNKVVFHEALVRRYPHDLHAIAIPDHIVQGDPLRAHLEGYFQRAREFTRDYQTVFGEHQYQAVAPRIPFYADPAVAYWRELVAQIHEFDFSKLDYEVIGSLFERLISPQERHKFGQYYTRSEVVDLINSFAIRTGRETVMDPSCGGGTFLVRAYARKKELNPAGTHVQRLADLFGVDLSQFAANLTTINLATRDLISDENYPQVARSDFFDVEPSRPLMNLPAKITAAGLGTGQTREVRIPMLDAVVGNPPYVRQEDIKAAPKVKGKKAAPPPGTKEFYGTAAARAAGGLTFSGRSDLHVYFWPHAAEFLHDGGYLCLLTSSQWLDVDYGFRLQEYLLRNFEIHAIIESVDEPWFVGARVVTCATILRRQRHEADRMAHPVRFVQLRRPIADVLAHDGTAAGAMSAADDLRDAILSAAHNTVTADYRVRVVKQGDLWADGVRIGQLVKPKKAAKAQKQAAIDGHQTGEYFGGKWGQYVRAPDVWFDLIDRCGGNLVPLAQLADIRFGLKSGNDNFFFPVDFTAESLKRYPDPETFRQQIGVDRKTVVSGEIKVLQCGERLGEVRIVESSVLQPEVHNLKDAKHYVIRAEDCRRLMLATGRKTADLPEFAKAYVAWGEQQNWHASPTVAARQRETKDWHDLTGLSVGPIFWSMRHGYRHITLRNPESLRCNKSFFDVTERNGKNDALWAVLNSTFTVIAKLYFGHPIGVEGYLETEVFEAKMMLVPDLRVASNPDCDRIVQAMNRMASRKPLNLIAPREFSRTKLTQSGDNFNLASLSHQSELDQPDRRELDDAVLQMIGFGDAAERAKLLDAMYAHLRQHFIEVRRKEEKANANKKKAKKGGRGSPGAMAATVVEQLRRDYPEVFRRYPTHFIDPGIMARALTDTVEVPPDGVPEVVELLDGSTPVRLRKGKRVVAEVRPNSAAQARLLVAVIGQGIRGLVTLPHEPAACEAVLSRFNQWVLERDEAFRQIIERHTADTDTQESLRALVLPMILAGPATESAAGSAN